MLLLLSAKWVCHIKFIVCVPSALNFRWRMQNAKWCIKKLLIYMKKYFFWQYLRFLSPSLGSFAKIAKFAKSSSPRRRRRSSLAASELKSQRENWGRTEGELFISLNCVLFTCCYTHKFFSFYFASVGVGGRKWIGGENELREWIVFYRFFISDVRKSCDHYFARCVWEFSLDLFFLTAQVIYFVASRRSCGELDKNKTNNSRARKRAS